MQRTKPHQEIHPDTEDDIRQDIRAIRALMTEKLEMLEKRVQETVGGAEETVKDIVENVMGTIDDAVGKVKETVGKVKGTVEDTVEGAKRTYDLTTQMARHPWMMLGGTMLLGYLLGRIGGRVAAGARPTAEVSADGAKPVHAL